MWRGEVSEACAPHPTPFFHAHVLRFTIIIVDCQIDYSSGSGNRGAEGNLGGTRLYLERKNVFF